MENNFGYRIAWALKQTGKSNDDLAQILGVNRNTIAAYKNRKGDLKGIVLVGLAEKFNFNPVWLLTGEGKPYRKGQGEFEGSTERTTSYKSGEKIASVREKALGGEYRIRKSFKISELTTKAIEVLESDTIYRAALSGNINAFHRSIQVENMLQKLDVRMAAIEGQLTELAQENMELKKRMKEKSKR